MSRGHFVLEHAIDEIKTGLSFRRDVEEDLDELCESIERIGLIHPPSVSEQGSLIDGRRRLAALKQLGFRTTPVWIVHGVSDKLSQVLAIRDENTLRKALKPVEQATLYEELKAIYGAEGERRKEASYFGATPAADADGGEDGGAESAPPSAEERPGGADSAPPARGPHAKSRVQAAQAVTGRDSRTMLEQVSELKRIAADDDEDPAVRQHAAEALIELNEDGKVNGRYQAVKHAQHLARLTRWADHPDTPDTARQAAQEEIAGLDPERPIAEAANEAGLAVQRVEKILTAAQSPTEGDARVGWADVDPLMREKHAIRRLVDLLRREHGWWDRTDPVDVGKYADDGQWELITSYVAGATAFLAAAQQARDEEPDDDEK